MNIKPLVLGAVILGLACLVATPLLGGLISPDGSESCDLTYARELVEADCNVGGGCGSSDNIVKLPANFIVYSAVGIGGLPLNPDTYSACFDLSGGAHWGASTLANRTVITSAGSSITAISESGIPAGPVTAAGGHGTHLEETICISFTIGAPNTDAMIDDLRFSVLQIVDVGCSLRTTNTLDLKVTLYNESGFVFYDTDTDLCIADSDYATKCTIHPGTRHIDVNKHREAFVCLFLFPCRNL